MLNWKLIGGLTGAIAFGLILVYVAFYFIFLELFVDLWWFRSLEFEGYFWLRLLYRFILSGGVTFVFFSIFFSHFWLASRYLGLNPPDEVLADPEKRQRFQKFSDAFMSGSVWVYTPLSLVLAIFIALPFYEQWEQAILYFFGSASGVTEPVYGNDISFYLFSYPIYTLIQQELLITAIALFFMVGILYWAEHTFIPNQSKDYPRGAKIHLTILVGFVLLFVVWGFLLDRFGLLYIGTNEPIFYGPGFVDLRYHLPLLWLAIGFFVATSITAISFIFSFNRLTGKLTLGFLTCFFMTVGLQKVDFVPEWIDWLYVKPNPVKAEKPFMQHNIDATLDAYDLKNIETIDFKVSLDATEDIESWANQQHFENIPVWDREYLNDGYMQLQGIRPYYSFPHVDEDRYFLHGHLQQVNLAAREMNISKLPKEAQNWENTHLRYTHGYGAVMTPAAQDAGKPIAWYLRDLNMTSDVGISIANPDIYYGLEDYLYAIVPNKLTVIGISGTDSSPSVSGEYQGKGGVPIPSLFRKLLFSAYYDNEKILFSNNITKKSKVLLRRNVIERVKTLTPFLHLDNDPYLVAGEDRFYWILDAYTLSNHYPVSKSVTEMFLANAQEFNYIRNAVKVVVDAYDGSTKYYISDPSDAIIRAYDRAYPSLFYPLDKMPEELKAHLRYPRDIYKLQMQIYAKYHQRSPELFYEQAETWEFANVNKKPVLPYYLTMDFGNCDNKEEFVMINPMTPIHRDNLSMIGVAGIMDKEKCTDEYKPGITIYKFRKDIQVNGPAQIDALIDQNPEISEQFTLWDQHGSKVVRGRMVILTMGNSILYVQPIYMISTKTKIPELTRIIVSIGNEVVMSETLVDAFTQLRNRFKQSGNEGESGISSDLKETIKTITPE